MPSPSRRPVAFVAHAYYEEDARVRRQAETLVAAGRPVDVFALRRPDDPPSDVIAGVRLHRVPVRRHQGAGLLVYLGEYLAFLAGAAWALVRAHRRRRYALVQVATLPDFLVVAALPLRLLGVPVVLDLHEAMPEFFATRFPRAASGPAVALLRLVERVSIGLADVALTVNVALADRLRGIGVPDAKVRVSTNSPSTALFDPGRHPQRPFLADGSLRLAYAGAVTPIYELEVAVRAVDRLRRERPELDPRLVVYGRGDSEEPLRALVAELGLGDRVTLAGRIPLDAVPAALAEADVVLAPTRLDAFTALSLSQKLFEAGAMGRPVVASRLPMVERTFPADTVRTYAPGDPEDLARAVLALVDDPADRERRVAATRRLVESLSWEVEGARYVALVESLARDGSAR